MNKNSSHLIKSAFTFKNAITVKSTFYERLHKKYTRLKEGQFNTMLFVCLFVRYADVTITGEGLQILTYARQ